MDNEKHDDREVGRRHFLKKSAAAGVGAGTLAGLGLTDVAAQGNAQRRWDLTADFVTIGEGRPGETPWPGTSALYVADLELAAPAVEGTLAWSACFPATQPGLPHEPVLATFSFRTARPPEHRITVKVTDKNTEAPLDNVDVRLGSYGAVTDAHGMASLELPGGTYNLDAWKVGYETRPKTVEVGQDLMIQVEAVCSPEKDPDDERVWM